MFEATVDDKGLKAFERQMEAAPDVFKDAKKRAHRTAANQLKETIDRQIGGTGKVQSWQVPWTGDGGGFARVRPKRQGDSGGTVTTKSGKVYAVGYISNAIDKGHKFPPNSGKQPRRYKSGRMNVPGKQYYSKAEPQAELIAQQAALSVSAALITYFEGDG